MDVCVTIESQSALTIGYDVIATLTISDGSASVYSLPKPYANVKGCLINFLQLMDLILHLTHQDSLHFPLVLRLVPSSVSVLQLMPTLLWRETKDSWCPW